MQPIPFPLYYTHTSLYILAGCHTPIPTPTTPIPTTPIHTTNILPTTKLDPFLWGPPPPLPLKLLQLLLALVVSQTSTASPPATTTSTCRTRDCSRTHSELYYYELKRKTLGEILRCRLWMQTNALSRGKIQVASLAEPKTPLESSVFV